MVGFLRTLWAEQRSHRCKHDWTSTKPDGSPVGYDMAFGSVAERCRRCGRIRWR